METEISPSVPPSPHAFLRRVFFIACIVIFVCTLLYLVYYNGKSLYDNGI